MNRKIFTGKTKGLDCKMERINEGEPNRISLNIPNGGTVEITGMSEFVSKIFRQLLEHPESLVANEIVTGYYEMSAKEQKRFRKFFKIGEFADANNPTWPAWLGE